MSFKPLFAATVLSLALASAVHAQTNATATTVAAHYATLVHANACASISRSVRSQRAFTAAPSR